MAKARGTKNIPGTASYQAFQNEERRALEQQEERWKAEEARQRAAEKAKKQQDLDALLGRLAEKINECFEEGRSPAADPDVEALSKWADRLRAEIAAL